MILYSHAINKTIAWLKTLKKQKTQRRQTKKQKQNLKYIIKGMI